MLSHGRAGGIGSDTDGHLIGKVPVPEGVSNICWGGRAKHQVFITATTSLYAISLNRNGAQTP